jgi:hypothetical protein
MNPAPKFPGEGPDSLLLKRLAGRRQLKTHAAVVVDCFDCVVETEKNKVLMIIDL